MRSRFLLTVSVSALVAGLGLTACSSSGSKAASAPTAAGAVSASPVAGQPETPAASGSASAPTASAQAAAIAKCRTQDLKWSVVRITNITDPNAKDPANGELVAVNTGAKSCTLAGFPKLAFHLGKGPEANGIGKGTPAPVAVAAGRKAVYALHYSELNGKGPDSANCQMVTANYADVTAPGESTGGRAQVVDQGGKPADISICGDTVRLSAPVTK